VILHAALAAAMSLELGRAKTELKRDGYPPPYFVSLSAIDVDSWEQRCEMGAPVFTGQYKQRLMLPDVRVGDYTLDNHPVNEPSGFLARGVSYEDDEYALRYGLWRLLDSAYKSAAGDFLRKQALRVARGKTEYDTDDLTREQPRHREAEQPASPWDSAALGGLTVEAGRALRADPDLLSADSSARLRRQWTELRDTDGSVVDFGRDVAELDVEASARSTDGTRLYVSRRFAATTPAGLPSTVEMRDAAADMLRDLHALEVASTTSPFSAPTLLDPSASAAVVLSVGLRLSGEEQRNPAGAQTFQGKLGKPVLPKDFSLVDDPTRADFGGKPLAGHYDFDDQGVPAQPVTLVQNGVLRGLLLSRYPVVGFSHSNGHGRAFAGYAPEGMPGSLFLTSAKPYTQQKLLDMLRAECRRQGKPYGIWVRKLRGFSQQEGTGGHTSIRFTGGLVYLVDAATGRLTLVRDLDLVGTPLVLLNNIRAAGDDVTAQNLVYGAPVSMVVPSVLLSEGELQRAEGRPENAPILPPPHAQASRGHVPTIPVVPHVQVQRYVVHDAAELPPRFVAEGVVASREHLEGKDLFLDFKVEGRTLAELGSDLRRLDEAVLRLAAGRAVEKNSLTPALPSSQYRARYGAGWPEPPAPR